MASLAYIQKVTCVAFQLVNTGFVVRWGSCCVCCFDLHASVFLPLKAIFTPACLNRLVTFLMFGDMKVNVPIFRSSWGVWVGWGRGIGFFSVPCDVLGCGSRQWGSVCF